MNMYKCPDSKYEEEIIEKVHKIYWEWVNTAKCDEIEVTSICGDKIPREYFILLYDTYGSWMRNEYTEEEIFGEVRSYWAKVFLAITYDVFVTMGKFNGFDVHDKKLCLTQNFHLEVADYTDSLMLKISEVKTPELDILKDLTNRPELCRQITKEELDNLFMNIPTKNSI